MVNLYRIFENHATKYQNSCNYIKSKGFLQLKVLFVHFLLAQKTNQKRAPLDFFKRYLAAFSSEKQQTQASPSNSCFFYPRSLAKYLKNRKGDLNLKPNAEFRDKSHSTILTSKKMFNNKIIANAKKASLALVPSATIG